MVGAKQERMEHFLAISSEERRKEEMNNIDPISGADLGCPNCAKLKALVDAMQEDINRKAKRIKELEDEMQMRDEE